MQDESPIEIVRTIPVLPAATEAPRLRRSSPGGRAQHRLHDRLAIGLAAVVALAPAPIGSNRPIFWAISAGILALFGLWYGLRSLRLQVPARIGLGTLPVESLLFALTCLYLCVQLLPLGLVLPIHWQTSAGLVLDTRTLSLTPGDTWLMLVRQLGFGLFFFFCIQVGANADRARILLYWIFAVVAGYALYGLVAARLGGTGEPGIAMGPFLSGNTFATFNACGLVIGIALLDDCRRNDELSWVSRLAIACVVLIGLVFIGATVFATGSRMGAVVAIAGSLTAVLIALVAFRASRRITLAALGLGAIAAVGLGVVYGSRMLDRLLTLGFAADLRWNLYVQIWNMIMQRPLLGYGGGSFATAFQLFERPPVPGDVVWDKAHSTYLALWSELGLVVGSLPILAILILGWRCARGLADPERRTMAIAAVGTIVAFGLHSLVDFSLEVQANTFLFLAVVALGFPGRDINRSH